MNALLELLHHPLVCETRAVWGQRLRRILWREEARRERRVVAAEGVRADVRELVTIIEELRKQDFIR